MSVILSLAFAAMGLFAVAAMLASWRRFAPAIARLRGELRMDPAAVTIRTTVLEHVLVRLRPNRGPLRHHQRPKPIVHRLHRRLRRRQAA